MARNRKFVVAGNTRFRGVNPGGQLTADPDDPAIQRRLRAGSLQYATTKKKEETGDA